MALLGLLYNKEDELQHEMYLNTKASIESIATTAYELKNLCLSIY